MTPTECNALGPIAQLRHAAESPLALALGAALGGLVPASTYVVAHVGQLVRVDGDRVFTAPWTHPCWLLVVGGLMFSAKTVYTWTVAAFDDRAKALGFVALVEGLLLLSPSPMLSYFALGYLVAINALGTGAALALRNRSDRVEAAPDWTRETSPEFVRETQVRNSSRAPKPAALPGPKPPEQREDLYARALEVTQQLPSVSTEVLRRELRCRQPTAAALLSQLEAAGIVGAANSADRGRRPVLLFSTES